MSTSNSQPIHSAHFVKGIVTDSDPILYDGILQVAFVGRSNVGKSSVINSLTGRKNLCRSSSTPGFTKEINFFLIQTTKDESLARPSCYLVDLPGYGFARGSHDERDTILELINSYIFNQKLMQVKFVVIVDAKVGLTKDDVQMLNILKERGRDFVVVANKIDKLKKSELPKALNAIRSQLTGYEVIPYSAQEGVGIEALREVCFG